MSKPALTNADPHGKMKHDPNPHTIARGEVNNMATTLSAKEVAERFETTPRTLRKFLRKDAEQNGTKEALPGKGSRYSFQAKDLKSLRKRLDVWMESKAQSEDGGDEAGDVHEDETE